jgi:hypothetical protein
MSENAGPSVNNTAGATSEYSFYQNVTYGATPYGLLNPSQKTLYGVLKQKVAYGGLEALNKKAMQSKGQVLDKNNSAAYQSAGERINPVIVSSIQDIKNRVGSATLVNTDHGREGNVKLPTGMYRDTGQNRYYLVLDTKLKTPEKTPTFTETALKTTQLSPLPVTDPFVGSPTSFATAQTAKQPDVDLLFNSPDYKSTYEEVIREMSLTLIMAGDDIISKYNYESIDSVPDIDIEIKISGGEYLNAKEVIDKGLGGELLQSLTDGSISSDQAEAANRLLLYLEKLIGEQASVASKLRYYGRLSPGNVDFVPGKTRAGESDAIDFYVTVPDEYQIPGVNELRIRFDAV